MHHAAHGCDLRKGRVSIAGQIYAVTTVTRGRIPVFTECRRARKLVTVMREHQISNRASTLCFVIMPDHLHWLLQLSEGKDLAQEVKAVKAISSRRIGFSIWQKGFYDRAIRQDEDVVSIARYMVSNPLRAGLVSSIGDYPHWDAVWL